MIGIFTMYTFLWQKRGRTIYVYKNTFKKAQKVMMFESHVDGSMCKQQTICFHINPYFQNIKAWKTKSEFDLFLFISTNF